MSTPYQGINLLFKGSREALEKEVIEAAKALRRVENNFLPEYDKYFREVLSKPDEPVPRSPELIDLEGQTSSAVKTFRAAVDRLLEMEGEK